MLILGTRYTWSMVEVIESTLPGVGRKYIMKLRSGGSVTVISKPDGTREMYHFKGKDDIPCDTVQFNTEEAQQFATLLGANFSKPALKEEIELVLGKLQLEWITLAEGTASIGHTLGELNLRALTGASVIAIMRDEEAIPNPQVSEVLQLGDTLVLIGTDLQIKKASVLLM